MTVYAARTDCGHVRGYPDRTWTAEISAQIIAVMSDATPKRDRIAALVDRAAIKAMYEPFTVIASVVGGMLASKVVARIWRAIAGEKDLPGATDQATSWAKILPAAALHGVVFAVVKAIVDRTSAKEFERLTGRWPGKSSPSRTASAQMPN